jgi:hypothetical protein
LVRDRSGTTMVVMTAPDPLHDPASALVEGAQAFHRAAEHRGSHMAAPASLESLQEALQVLSAAWYRLAADASAGIVERELPRGVGVTVERPSRQARAHRANAAAMS